MNDLDIKVTIALWLLAIFLCSTILTIIDTYDKEDDFNEDDWDFKL